MSRFVVPKPTKPVNDRITGEYSEIHYCVLRNGKEIQRASSVPWDSVHQRYTQAIPNDGISQQLKLCVERVLEESQKSQTPVGSIDRVPQITV
jgi:hypothetical protein